MSAGENKAVGNLIVLCTAHANEIDDASRIEDFPVALLKEWKQRQLDEYDRLRSGWHLTDEDASEVGRSSFDTTIDLRDAVVSLGGEGGQAPGAGGGGGGAMGSGTTGGAGGLGGNIILEGAPVRAFGAGGGGVGAFGEGAIGGEGGGGGEFVQKWFNADDLPDTVTVTVGRGGRPVIGGDGGHGEDSSFGNFVHAPGGKGGKAGQMGNLPSRAGDPSEIAIVSALYANAAELRDGLLYILGGGWDTYALPAIPDLLSGFIAVIFEVDQTDTRRTFGLLFEFINPIGDVIYSTPIVLDVGEQGGRVPQILFFQANIEMVGTWSTRLSLEGAELLRLPLEMKASNGT
jgi:hypothetical protein